MPMTHQFPDLQDTAIILSRDFETAPSAIPDLPEESGKAYDLLLSWLIEEIDYLIHHNFEKLLLLLYRVDVDEAKLKALLAQHSPSEAPKLLACLILDRQLEKSKTRRLYRSDAQAGDPEERW